jgi:hypothetical protein
MSTEEEDETPPWGTLPVEQYILVSYYIILPTYSHDLSLLSSQFPQWVFLPHLFPFISTTPSTHDIS